jgi:signal peptidase I
VSRRGFFLRLIIAVVVLGAIATFAFRVFFVRFVRVPTGAMMNTILPGDQLIGHKLLGSPARGDIVVFQYPKDEARYVSRVIGLPGETIQLKGQLVYINGRALDEQRVLVASGDNPDGPLQELTMEGSGPYRVYYVKPRFTEDETPAETPGDIAIDTPFQIPNDSYFVLGDNRENSYDSRYRGAVPSDLIWGKCSFIYVSERQPERIFRKVQ